MHGGSAKQVKMAAAERLQSFVDPALTQLAHLMEWADNDAVKLAAVRDILDRAGYKPREKIETTGRTLIEVVYSDRNTADPALPAATTHSPTPDYS